MRNAVPSFETRPQPTFPFAKDFKELAGEILARYSDRLVTDSTLTRPLVSFQANKNLPRYRWFKYKEAFSAELVERLLRRFGIHQGSLLDPFAGSGVALFASSRVGLDADGIELLPIGQQIIRTRLAVENGPEAEDIEELDRWIAERPWRSSMHRIPIRTLRITAGAYPPKTLKSIEHFLGALMTASENVAAFLKFALLCILESISYTRKDGQYLRWDQRAGRRVGERPFNKGKIEDFDFALVEKLTAIRKDIRLSNTQSDLFEESGDKKSQGLIKLFEGSCLNWLPKLPSSTYDVIFTSPPYCNRYDYTRTYALELALLDTDEKAISEMRQQMLSCTVENREKALQDICKEWSRPLAIIHRQELLTAILDFLEGERSQKRLNNNGIPRMVHGYFQEMACVIAECGRVLRSGGRMIMVNDNVRYAGVSIPVDLILSDIARQMGFAVEQILVLPNGKGNSSQQMGEHGRDPLRKCIYIWRRE